VLICLTFPGINQCTCTALAHNFWA